MTTLLDELGVDETRHDPDDAVRELQERAHLIQQMQETQGWKLWADFLAALASGYQNRLLKGRHKDLLDYKYDAGVVEGIRLALTAHENLASRVSAAERILAEDKLADQEDES